MLRIPTVVSWLAVVPLAACCPPVASPATTPAAPAEPPSVVPTEPPPGDPPPTAPAAPPRTDLSALPDPLPATIALPAGATVESATESNLTADGFAYATPVARIGGGGLPGTIEISTGDKLGWTPTTLAADQADVARAGHEPAGTAEGPGGNWAAAYKLTDSCYVRSWSPTATLWCEVSSTGKVGVACDQVQQVLDVCVTLAPAGTAVAPRLDPAASFPNVKDARAIETAVAAGRAVASNDLAAFTALLVPGKIKLGKRKVDAKGFAAALAKAGSLSKLLGNDCTPSTDRAWTCRWNADGDGATGTLSILARDGYGVIPSIELVRQPDGSWKVAGFGVIDFGEP